MTGRYKPFFNINITNDHGIHIVYDMVQAHYVTHT